MEYWNDLWVMNCRGHGRKQSWPVLTPWHLPVDPEENCRIVSQYNQCLNQKSNWASPEYKSKRNTHPSWSVCLCDWYSFLIIIIQSVRDCCICSTLLQQRLYQSKRRIHWVLCQQAGRNVFSLMVEFTLLTTRTEPLSGKIPEHRGRYTLLWKYMLALMMYNDIALHTEYSVSSWY